jgi:DNA-binding LytR/AlgR family response regulator
MSLDNVMDLILLSTRLSDINGYAIAELIGTRWSKRESKLIFLGEEGSDVLAAFAYQPFGYIPKNQWDARAENVLWRLWRCDHRERSVEVLYQKKKKYVRVSNIMYIEVQGHSLTVWCERGECYRFTGRLSEYEKLLEGYYFVRSSKSFLVNCAYVHGITDMVRLKNGCEIPCSRSYSSGIRQMWDRYMREMAHAL